MEDSYLREKETLSIRSYNIVFFTAVQIYAISYIRVDTKAFLLRKQLISFFFQNVRLI